MSCRVVEATSILAGWHFAAQLVEEVQQHGYPIRGYLLLLPCPGIQNNREALADRKGNCRPEISRSSETTLWAFRAKRISANDVVRHHDVPIGTREEKPLPIA